jgi:hypothetical protein
MTRLGLQAKLDKAAGELAEVEAERNQLREEVILRSAISEGTTSQLQRMEKAVAEGALRAAGLESTIRGLNRDIDRLGADKKALEETITIMKLELESLRDMQREKNLVDAEVQTKKYAKASKPPVTNWATEVPAASVVVAPPPPALTVNDIQELRHDYDACADMLDGENFGLTFEKFQKLKAKILEENGLAPITAVEFASAQDGNIPLINGNRDHIQLYVHAMMKRIMERATYSCAHEETGCQTTPHIQPRVSSSTWVQPDDLLMGKFSDAFTKLLDQHYCDRPPRTFEWILKSARSIFDEKTMKDAVDAREGRPPSSMPQFALQWATRQYGLNFLAHQCCWDLVNSARAHCEKYLEIDLFRRFLDTDYSTAQLTFFHRVRASCLRRGISIPAKTKDGEEPYTDVILTSSNAIELVRRVFKRAGDDLIDMNLRQLASEFVKKPSPTVDPSLLYIQMGVLLRECVTTFARYELLELRKMIHWMELTPQLDGKAFRKLVKELIPSIDDADIAELFRAMNAHGPGRAPVKRARFKRLFQERSLLNSENVFEVIGTPSPELAKVREKWGKLQPECNRELEKATGSEDPGLTHATQCLRLEMDQVSAALACLDVIGAQSHLLSCMLAYQKVLWAKQAPDVDVIEGVTEAVRGILRL